LFRTPSFWGHVAETAHALGYALVLSLIGGIGLGVLLGVNRTSGTVAEPILIALYSVPKVTLYPLVLLCFGSACRQSDVRRHAWADPDYHLHHRTHPAR